MRIANMIFGAIFIFGAAVQINDPDPVPWIAIYLAALAACIVANRAPRDLALPVIVGVLAAGWAALIAARASAWAPVGMLFAQWEMQNQAVEETREVYGLLIILLWMIVLAVRAWLLRRRSPAATGTGARTAA